MTTMFAKFKTAALIILVLGGGALAAVPAQAQAGPSFNFSLDIPGGFGGQGGMSFGQEGRFGPRHGGGYDDSHSDRCLTNREVRRGVSAYGYSRVEVRRQLPRDRVEVVAQYGNWLYSMRVDKCSGEVDRIERIRRERGGGFGLQFGY